MRITQFFSSTSKMHDTIVSDYEHSHGSLFDRYEKPSSDKIRTWEAIKDKYNRVGNVDTCYVYINHKNRPLKYNDDLMISGASSWFYSTTATFTDIENGDIYIIKETHANTYATLYKEGAKA